MCLVNKCLLGQAEAAGPSEEFSQPLLGSSVSAHLAHTVVIYGTAPFLEQVLYLLQAVSGRVKGPESLGP